MQIKALFADENSASSFQLEKVRWQKFFIWRYSKWKTSETSNWVEEKFWTRFFFKNVFRDFIILWLDLNFSSNLSLVAADKSLTTVVSDFIFKDQWASCVIVKCTHLQRQILLFWWTIATIMTRNNRSIDLLLKTSMTQFTFHPRNY